MAEPTPPAEPVAAHAGSWGVPDPLVPMPPFPPMPKQDHKPSPVWIIVGLGMLLNGAWWFSHDMRQKVAILESQNLELEHRVSELARRVSLLRDEHRVVADELGSHVQEVLTREAVFDVPACISVHRP